ncbi:sensor histidine kinase [Anaerostipes butyraticus]|uniref:sensor histidine kinase n=1 Tax=Anaerostipes butyraticus TaxID=645466 RepID=UPI0023A82E88|nr:HAMP domain-containing sensor histidine kinase [Anaerostipes butyraticus]
MRKCSIKMKVTLWYTGILSVILGIVLAGIFIFTNVTGLSVTEEEVQGAVTGFVGNIRFQDSTFYMDGDTEFYNDGIMFCVYDQDGQLLYGSMPVDFPSRTALQSHNARIIENGQKQWMIYDAAYSYGNGKALWVRGITSIHNMEVFLLMARRALLILFPGIVLLIGAVGYFMTKRALRPVDDICERADHISGGDDLSQRLPLPKVRDEMYHLTERFNEMFERLQKSFEKEKQFASDASHELRTPVAVLISQCEYLLEHGELGQEQKEEVQVILRQAKKMSALVSQMLMIAREEKMADPEQFEDVDFGMLAEIVSEEMESQAAGRGISIHVDVQEQQIVRGDQTLLMRMMMNLIQNAVLYGKKGGNVWVRVFEKNGMVNGEVEDDGIGIRKENLDKIWNRFYREDKSRGEEEGTGLGLSMVKWIVKVHGGRIRVRSQKGKGSVFSFSFPENR